MSLYLKRPAQPVFHPIGAACGFYAAKFMLALVGGELWETVPQNLRDALGKPVWPADLARLLTQSGHPAHVHLLGHLGAVGRRDFIHGQIAMGKPVALFVRAKLVSLHWLVVCGETPPFLLVYDPREKYGPSSEKGGCPIGNRRIPTEDVFSLWWGSLLFPRQQYQAVAFV